MLILNGFGTPPTTVLTQFVAVAAVALLGYVVLIRLIAVGTLVRSRIMGTHSPTVLRGIRGATTVTEDTAQAILEATEELVREIAAANGVRAEDVGSALFTVTPDLRAGFPAAAARRMGWTMVPLLNFTEIGVPGGLQRCIRVLVHVNTSRSQNEMVHVYLREAVALRPDLAGRPQAAGAGQASSLGTRSTSPQ